MTGWKDGCRGERRGASPFFHQIRFPLNNLPNIPNQNLGSTPIVAYTWPYPSFKERKMERGTVFLLWEWKAQFHVVYSFSLYMQHGPFSYMLNKTEFCFLAFFRVEAGRTCPRQYVSEFLKCTLSWTYLPINFSKPCLYQQWETMLTVPVIKWEHHIACPTSTTFKSNIPQHQST